MPAIPVDRGVVMLLLAGSGGLAIADEETAEPPAVDMEFLEYLGSWDAADDEWMLFAGDAAAPAARDNPAPDRAAPVGQDPRESDDER